MTRVLVIFFLLAHTAVSSSKAQSIIKIDSLNAKEIYVSWSTESSKCNGYLTGYGEVECKGKLVLKREMQTELRLFYLSESGNNIRSISTSISPIGIKGGDFPEFNSNEFKYPLKLRKDKSELVNFLATARAIFQDSLDFSINEISSSQSLYIVTNRSEKNYLIDRKTERRIGARKLSYRLIVSKLLEDNNDFEIEISLALQYRKLVEQTWRPEINEEIYIKERDRLVKML